MLNFKEFESYKAEPRLPLGEFVGRVIDAKTTPAVAATPTQKATGPVLTITFLVKVNGVPVKQDLKISNWNVYLPTKNGTTFRPVDAFISAINRIAEREVDEEFTLAQALDYASKNDIPLSKELNAGGFPKVTLIVPVHDEAPVTADTASLLETAPVEI